MKRIIALIGLFMMSLPTLIMAQDKGTYIENLGAQDSSYMDETLSSPAQQASSSNSTVIIVIVVVVVIAVAAFFLLKKKKK